MCHSFNKTPLNTAYASVGSKFMSSNFGKHCKNERKKKVLLRVLFSFKHDQDLATVQLNIPKINTIIICKIN